MEYMCTFALNNTVKPDENTACILKDLRSQVKNTSLQVSHVLTTVLYREQPVTAFGQNRISFDKFEKFFYLKDLNSKLDDEMY